MRRLLLSLALSLVALAACSSPSDDDASSGASSAPPGAAEAAGDADADAGAGAGGDAIAAVPIGAPVGAGRSIIATATTTVSVDDVEVAARRAVERAVVAGGFLAGQESRLEAREVLVTLRVPSPQFHLVLADVSDLGEVVEADVATQDVTEVVVDLDSRITSARTSTERLRSLLERAGDVAQLAAVEGELARREAEVESLLGRRRVLEDQVDLSTLDVRFTEVGPAPADDAPGFVDALGTGWAAFAAVGRAALVGVGFALPFAAAALVVVLALVTLRRRGTGIEVRSRPEG